MFFQKTPTVLTKKSSRLAIITLLCSLAAPSQAFLGFGKKPDNGVSMGDTSGRTHTSADLTIADLLAFANNVTNKMLSSPRLKDWSTKPPKLILGSLVNNTDNPNLRVNDMYDRVVEIMLNANVARIVDRSAEEFDYIVKSEVSSNRQYGDNGQQLAEYIITFKLFSVEGELQGQWSDRLNLVKGKRKMW